MRVQRKSGSSEDLATPDAQVGELGQPKRARGGVKQRKAPAVAPTKTRRRPALTAAGVALIALGGIGGGVLASQGGQAQEVVMLRNSIQPGHQITVTDLTTTELTGAAGVNLVKAADLQQLVGRYPTGVIPAGSLVSWPMTATMVSPSGNSALIGLAFKQGHVPVAGLQPGQTVSIVLTNAGGNSGGLPDGLTVGQSWSATIADIPDPNANSQLTTVDLYIASKDISAVSSASGAGDLALAVTGAGS